jgi:hypothetical protein
MLRISRDVFAEIFAPAALLAAVLVWILADRNLGVGPLDRAQAIGYLALPLALLSPGAAAIGLRFSLASFRARYPGLLGLGIGAFFAVILVSSMGQIGCQPASPADSVWRASAIGALAGGGFALSSVIALRFERQMHRLAGFVAGACTLALVGAAMLAVFVALYPTGTCALAARVTSLA